jgi:hypothetical protein
MTIDRAFQLSLCMHVVVVALVSSAVEQSSPLLAHFIHECLIVPSKHLLLTGLYFSTV